MNHGYGKKYIFLLVIFCSTLYAGRHFENVSAYHVMRCNVERLKTQSGIHYPCVQRHEELYQVARETRITVEHHYACWQERFGKESLDELLQNAHDYEYSYDALRGGKLFLADDGEGSVCED